MDHIGIDVHKTESQICIVGAGERADRAARPYHPRAVRRRPGRPPAGPHPPRGLDRERVGGAVSGTAGARGDRRRPELRPDVRGPQSQDQDGSPRRPGAGRGLSAGGLPPRPSALRCSAPCARAPDGTRRPGAHPHRVHQRDPRPAPAGWLARANRQCRGLHSPRPRPVAPRPAAVGARPPARRHAPGQPAARVLR